MIDAGGILVRFCVDTFFPRFLSGMSTTMLITGGAASNVSTLALTLEMVEIRVLFYSCFFLSFFVWLGYGR